CTIRQANSNTRLYIFNIRLYMFTSRLYLFNIHQRILIFVNCISTFVNTIFAFGEHNFLNLVHFKNTILTPSTSPLSKTKSRHD
ncbi:MAG: hypothetical protein NTX03_12870, partial [Bacteroidetes bacterium]|nr:hypothetical protein [Bacteroidota bacterium]